jgi:hypothetical protein
MSSPPHLRRFAGLTVLFLGLLGMFATLTLAAQGKGRWVVFSALVGISLALGGLRLLDRGSP